MLDGQCAGFCHLNGTAIRTHWNARIGRPEQARKFPGSAAGRSRVAASAAGSVPGGSEGKPTNQG